MPRPQQSAKFNPKIPVSNKPLVKQSGLITAIMNTHSVSGMKISQIEFDLGYYIRYEYTAVVYISSGILAPAKLKEFKGKERNIVDTIAKIQELRRKYGGFEYNPEVMARMYNSKCNSILGHVYFRGDFRFEYTANEFKSRISKLILRRSVIEPELNSHNFYLNSRNTTEITSLISQAEQAQLDQIYNYLQQNRHRQPIRSAPPTSPSRWEDIYLSPTERIAASGSYLFIAGSSDDIEGETP